MQRFIGPSHCVAKDVSLVNRSATCTGLAVVQNAAEMAATGGRRGNWTPVHPAVLSSGVVWKWHAPLQS